MNANVIEVKPFNITKIELVALRGPKGETGYPTPEEIQTAVDAWLEDHPEATTTVQDGSITTVKLADNAVTEDKLSESLQSLLITDTASGSIASFSDGSDGINVRDLRVDIEPVQDLHGYSNPWPAGGGKNLVKSFNPITISGVTAETTASGEIWIHGTPTISSGNFGIPTNAYFPTSIIDKTVTISVNEKTAGIGFAVGSTNGGLNLTMSTTNTSSTGVYTVNAGSNPGQLTINVRYDVGAIDKKYKVQLEVGSSATSWTPYSNICPITGWENVKVTRTGVNVWDGTSEAGYIDVNTGAELPNANQSRSFYIRVLPSTQYKFVNENASTGVRIAFYDKYKNYVSGLANSNANPQTFTTPSTAWYLRFYWGDISKVSINYPATYTSYIAPSAASITIPLGSTVYGGTLDVTTGVLTVDRAMHTFDGTETISVSSNSFHYSLASNPSISNPSLLQTQSSLYPSKTADTVYENRNIAGFLGVGANGSSLLIVDNVNFASKDVTAFKSYLQGLYANGTPLTVVWKLATPTTVQLTAQQLSTLLGVNNVFSDAGDVDATYVADTKLYIAKMIANALNA